MLGTDILSEARFELLAIGAERQAAAGENLLDTVSDPLAILGGEVDACRRHHANCRTLHIVHRGLWSLLSRCDSLWQAPADPSGHGAIGRAPRTIARQGCRGFRRQAPERAA